MYAVNACFTARWILGGNKIFTFWDNELLSGLGFKALSLGRNWLQKIKEIEFFTAWVI